MQYLGIDPGARGALCLLDPFSNTTFLDLTLSNPAMQVYDFVRSRFYGQNPCVVALEDVHSLPGMSAKSNFTFGGMFWRIRTILECANVKYEFVQPKVWQAAVGAPTRKFLGDEMDLKTAVADLAFGYYPDAELYGPKGGLLDGRSDALMIAHYLKLKYGGDMWPTTL